MKTAEAVYAYITGNPEYSEEHTALEDSKIEAAILFEAWKRDVTADGTVLREYYMGCPDRAE